MRCFGLPRPDDGRHHGGLSTGVCRSTGCRKRIRTDNGEPFAAASLGRLSRLSVWWIRLGIYPELIEPASPYQNGAHERMHRTLKADTTRSRAAHLAAQQQRPLHAFDDGTTRSARTKPWGSGHLRGSTSPRRGACRADWRR